jgi:hypothetical protein
MKIYEKNKWMAIALFYVIAVITRAIVLWGVRSWDIKTDSSFLWLWDWASGIGPCLGAFAAVLICKRKFYCSITGTSLWKSVLTVAIPFLVCFFQNRELSFILVDFIIYSFLEKVGWRGYLQGELKDMNPALRVLVIGLMWFFWHIAIGFNLANLIFLAILLFGTWGIGNIARDTRSLSACACFHTLFNFSFSERTHSFFEFSPLVITIYVVIIISWFVIWYAPLGKGKTNSDL